MANYKITIPAPRAFEDTLAITKALADEQRLRILMALAGGERCVCQITELLALAPSTVSKHMAILRQARLVKMRKQGRWVWYRRAGEGDAAEARTVLDWLDDALAEAPLARADREALRAIVAIDPEELCRRQCKC